MMSTQNASFAGVHNSNCSDQTADQRWEESMNKLYTYVYLFIFIPGILENSIALWMLCRFISKKTKAIIFMINLAIADLAHVLSLPLRVYYYITLTWPFGKGLCLLCFYLKYLNMYASIAFLVCISIQRCAFLMRPFCARQWKRRYDVRISIVVWLIVGCCCSPFIVMRNISQIPHHKTSTPENTIKHNETCFKDLPMRKLSLKIAVAIMSSGELLGFVAPLTIIILCSYFIMHSLKQSLGHSVSVNEKRRALRMVLVCTGVFLFCFAPYHINFFLYMMVSQDIITQCSLRQAVKQFHPISLCIASLNCCLNPLIYYFLTTEFRQQLSRQGSSILRGRLMSMESTSSYREAPS
ncbi:putative P2Y purinoceptor 10 [Tachysurus vachellii]|nr:putative P2Y purinoceptor 10 [Tachysurus vachellii]